MEKKIFSLYHMKRISYARQIFVLHTTLEESKDNNSISISISRNRNDGEIYLHRYDTIRYDMM